MAIPIYDLIFDAEAMEGVYAISLVNDPATSYMAVQLSNEKPVQWKLSSQEQRILVSPVLVPEQLIFRKNINGSPAYLKVTAEVIKKLQQNFSRQGYQNNVTLEHAEKISEGVSFVETWIVYNSQNDKANALGFDVPAGTWMMSCQLSEELWNEYVKSGEVKGFSMEAFLMPQLTNNKFNNEMEIDKDLIKSIVLEAIKEVKLAQETSEVIVVKLKYDIMIDGEAKMYADAFDMGSIVYNMDDSIAAVVEFDYDGNHYKTDDTGAIIDIQPIMVDAPKAEATTALVETIAPEVQNMLDEKDAKIAELEAEVMKLQADLTVAKEENIQMSKEKPASAGLKDIPNEVIKDPKDMTALELHRYNKQRFDK